MAGLTSIEEVIKLTEADDEVNAEEKIKNMKTKQIPIDDNNITQQI